MFYAKCCAQKLLRLQWIWLANHWRDISRQCSVTFFRARTFCSIYIWDHRIRSSRHAEKEQITRGTKSMVTNVCCGRYTGRGTWYGTMAAATVPYDVTCKTCIAKPYSVRLAYLFIVSLRLLSVIPYHVICQTPIVPQKQSMNYTNNYSYRIQPLAA